MKITEELTPEQQDKICSQATLKELSELSYNKEDGSYSRKGVEYVTEEEAYESLLDDIEL